MSMQDDQRGMVRPDPGRFKRGELVRLPWIGSTVTVERWDADSEQYVGRTSGREVRFHPDDAAREG